MVRRTALAAIAGLFLVLTGCSAHAAQPLPARLVQLWSASANGAAFSVSGTVVAVTSANGEIDIRDARNGRLRHPITPPRGWRFRQIGIVGGRLFAGEVSTAPSGGTHIKLAAYSISTGQRKWQATLQVGSSAFVSTFLITSAGIVVQASSAGLIGVRLNSGTVAWRSAPKLCPTGRPVGAAGVDLFTLTCTANQIVVRAISPADGRLRWRHVFSVADASKAAPTDLYPLSNGGVLIQLEAPAYILSPAGRLILSMPQPTSCPMTWCIIQADGVQGILQRGPDTGLGIKPSQEFAEGINLTTGAVDWRRPGELFAAGLPVTTPVVESSGLAYGYAGRSFIAGEVALGASPAFVTVLQAATGRSVVLPLPVTEADGVGLSLVGADDGMLFALSGAAPRLLAFGPAPAAGKGPAILAGVPTSQWPDACALLTAADLNRIAAGYAGTPERALTLSGITSPRPNGCAFVGPSSAPVVTVAVAWIARTTQQAAQLISSYLEENSHSRIRYGYLVNDGTVTGGADRALIQVGRAIVEVTVPGHPQDARELAQAVVARLKPAYG
jgi:outer membrane protein assembly factor BamB